LGERDRLVPVEGREGGRGPTLDALAGIALTGWGLLIGLAPLRDNSFLTHLATGRLIVADGIPRSDPYSFTARGEPWVVQSWLASTIYGRVERWWGADGLRVLMGLTTAAITALVWRLTRPAASLIGRVGVTGLVVAIGTEAWSERPLLLGLLFLCLLLLMAEDGLDPRWAIPVMWLWVNVHGSFPLGLVAVGLLLAGRRLDGEPVDVEKRVLLWAVVGTLLGGINPLGPRILVFPLELLARSEVLQLITEWRAPTFDTFGQRLFILQAVVAVVLVVRRPRYRIVLPLVLFTAAALIGLRNIPVASIALVPGMAWGLQGVGTISGHRRSPVITAGCGLLAALFVVLGTSTLGERDYDLEGYPVAAVAWMDDQGMLGPESRVVSRDFAGNYLEAVYGDDARVFMDDRYDMFPSPIPEDYIDLLRRQGWKEILDRYEPTAVLWDRETQLGQILPEADDWGVVYADDLWLVACPRPSPDEPPDCTGA
jgi:hypothetical protein